MVDAYQMLYKTLKLKMCPINTFSAQHSVTRLYLEIFGEFVIYVANWNKVRC